MTLDIDKDSLEFIRHKGGVCSVYELYPKNTFEPFPQVSIDYQTPEGTRGYDVYEQEGVVLHIDRRLFFQNSIIKVRLKRFLCLRWLELPTQSFFNSSG